MTTRAPFGERRIEYRVIGTATDKRVTLKRGLALYVFDIEQRRAHIA